MTNNKSYSMKFGSDISQLKENQSCAAMAEIIYTNHEQIIKHLANPCTNFDKISPGTLISMISANLILNMFDNIIDTDSIETKLAVANEFIDRVKDLFLSCIMKSELRKDHEGNVN